MQTGYMNLLEEGSILDKPRNLQLQILVPRYIRQLRTGFYTPSLEYRVECSACCSYYFTNLRQEHRVLPPRISLAFFVPVKRVQASIFENVSGAQSHLGNAFQ